MPKQHVRCLLIVLLMAGQLKVDAQKYSFRHFTADNGLPSSEVYHVTQDSKGFIWIATDQGVSRFEGRNFRNFDLTSGMAQNTVFEVYEDYAGRIWFIGFPFQLSYYFNDSIYTYEHNHVLSELEENVIPVKRSFSVDEDDNIFFSLLQNGNIYKLTNEGRLLILNKPGNKIRGLTIQQRGKDLLVAKDAGKRFVNYFSIHTKKILIDTIYSFHQNWNSAGAFYIQGTLASDGKVYLIHTSDLVVIDTLGKAEAYRMNREIIWVGLTNDTIIWIGKHKGGVDMFSSKKGRLSLIDNFLGEMSVSSVCSDHEGGLWMSTLENGVYYFPSLAMKSFSLTNAKEFSARKIHSIEIFRDKLLIGHDGGSIDEFENDNLKSFIKLDISRSLLIKAYKDQQLWIFNNKDLFLFKDGYPEKLPLLQATRKQYPKEKSLVIYVKSILPLGPDMAFLAFSSGLGYYYNGDFLFSATQQPELSIRAVALEKESDTSILMGAINGLWRISSRTTKYLGEEHPLLAHRITDIVILNEPKVVVMGTKGAGLMIMQGDSVFSITREQGLTSNSITSLYFNKNQLWVATNDGLNLLDANSLLHEPQIMIFKTEHGLISNEITQLKGDDKNIYIATAKGLTVFNYPHYIKTQPPAVFIENIEIKHKPEKEVIYDRLKHNQNFLKFHFTGIALRDAPNLQFKYRLVGLSENWTSTPSQVAEFTLLPPGQYRFEVVAINSDGVASHAPAVCEFTILSPWWQKTWFRIIAAILLLAGITSLFINRVRKVRAKSRLMNDILWYRQKALANQMDPHFVFNTLNSIQSYILTHDSSVSASYLSKFARLMRMILNSSEKQLISIYQEIESLRLYLELEAARLEERFEYSLVMDSSIEEMNYSIPPFIIQPFVENSIWHGLVNLDRPGWVQIDFRKEKNQLLVTVQDNGIGRRQAQTNTRRSIDSDSKGILLVADRLKVLSKLYNADMTFSITDLYSEQGEPMGTRVEIRLPALLQPHQKREMPY